MKKLILLSALILAVGLTYGQNLQKGNLLGAHTITVTLKPGATMDQFADFMEKKFAPEFEKQFMGWKVYLAKGVRGENKDSLGWVFVIKSEKDRDKYYNADGSLNDLGNKAFDKMKPILDEFEKIGTWTSMYTDWVIQ